MTAVSWTSYEADRETAHGSVCGLFCVIGSFYHIKNKHISHKNKAILVWVIFVEYNQRTYRTCRKTIQLGE